MENQNFLQISGLKKSFGSGENRTEVLRGLDFTVTKGEICVLLGPSGSGKSTILNIIGGIDGADEGSITIEGERLEDMTEKKLSLYRRKHLGYIFQMYNLIPNLTVRENIEVGAYLSDHPLDVDELLHTLGLYEHQKKLPNQLSGGQQQRVAIARALASPAKVLLADEPTGNLDEDTAKDIVEIFKSLAHDQDKCVIVVTHSKELAEEADVILTLKQGTVIATEDTVLEERIRG